MPSLPPRASNRQGFGSLARGPTWPEGRDGLNTDVARGPRGRLRPARGKLRAGFDSGRSRTDAPRQATAKGPAQQDMSFIWLPLLALEPPPIHA